MSPSVHAAVLLPVLSRPGWRWVGVGGQEPAGPQAFWLQSLTTPMTMLAYQVSVIMPSSSHITTHLILTLAP